MIEIESGFTGISFPLTHPRIGAFRAGGTVAVSSEAAGFPGTNAANELTWDFWKPTSHPATWTLTFASRLISYVGIASHNCATVGATVRVQRWDGAAWVSFATHVPTDNSPILFLLASRTLDQIRVRITDAIATIGVIYVGRVEELPQKCVWTGSLPFNEATQSAFSTNVSDGGHVLGRYETRKAVACSMTVNNLSEAWAATNMIPLSAQMADGPVFMADRPLDYPASVVFGTMAAPLQAPRAMPVLGAARSLTINITGHNPV